MIENFRSLLDFQGVSEVLGKKVKAKIEKVEESDMIWNIFDDAKLRNIENELGSQLTIIDSHAVGVTGLTCGFGDRGIIEKAIRTLRVWHIFKKNFFGWTWSFLFIRSYWTLTGHDSLLPRLRFLWSKRIRWCIHTHERQSLVLSKQADPLSWFPLIIS